MDLPGVTSVHVSAPEVRANAPPNIVLYRGSRLTRLQSAFDINGCMVRDTTLYTNGPGDFNNGIFNSIYMAVDFEVAKRYAAWAKRRDDNQPAGILRVEMPNAAIESLSHPEKKFLYWPTQEWKELVWKCRRREKLLGKMKQIRNTTLMIGTICGKPNEVIARLPSPDHITESMLIRTSSGRPAVQYVFTDEDGGAFLVEHCQRSSRVYTLAAADLAMIEAEDSSRFGDDTHWEG